MTFDGANTFGTFSTMRTSVGDNSRTHITVSNGGFLRAGVLVTSEGANASTTLAMLAGTYTSSHISTSQGLESSTSWTLYNADVTTGNVSLSTGGSSSTTMQLSGTASLTGNGGLRVALGSYSSATFSMAGDSEASFLYLQTNRVDTTALAYGTYSSATVLLQDNAKWTIQTTNADAAIWAQAGSSSAALQMSGASQATIATVYNAFATGISSSANVSLSGSSSFKTYFHDPSGATTTYDYFTFAHGNYSSATLSMADDATASISYASVSFAAGSNSKAQIDLSGSASLNILNTTTLSFARGQMSSATISLTDNATLQSDTVTLFAEGANSSVSLSLAGESKVDSAQNVNIANASGSAATVTLADNALLTAGTYLYVANGTNSQATLSMTGGTFSTVTVTDSVGLATGYGSTVSLNQSGGLVESKNSIFVGHRTNSHATWNLSGGSASAVSVIVGNQGTGTLAMTGGTLAATTVSLGAVSGAKGFFSMTSGTATLGALNVANTAGATGDISLSGNAKLYVETLSMAVSNYAVGTFSGQSTTTIGTHLRVGVGMGAAVYMEIAESASMTIYGSASVGFGSGGNTFLVMTGGQLNALTVTGSTTAGALYVGWHTGVNGTMTIGGTAKLNVQTLSTGNVGGTANVYFGGDSENYIGGAVLLGSRENSQASSMTISESAITNVQGFFYVANAANASASLNIAGGTTNVTGGFGIGTGSGSNATFVMSEGTLNLYNIAQIGLRTNSQVVSTLSGGTINAMGSNYAIANGDGIVTTMSLEGTHVKATTVNIANAAVSSTSSSTFGGTAYVTLSGGTLAASANLFMANQASTAATLTINGGTLTVGNNMQIGNGGTATNATLLLSAGHVYVQNTLTIAKGGYAGISGTGILAAGTLSIDNGGIFRGRLFVGALSGAPANYARVNNLVLAIGVQLQDDTYLSSTGRVSLVVSGSSDSGADALIQMANIIAENGAQISVDLTNFVITGEETVDILSYVDATNLNGVTITVTGYNQSNWIVEGQWNETTKMLELMILIPEPAANAALLGLLALAVAVRRKK